MATVDSSPEIGLDHSNLSVMAPFVVVGGDCGGPGSLRLRVYSDVIDPAAGSGASTRSGAAIAEV
jgi:hypothetical protein